MDIEKIKNDIAPLIKKYKLEDESVDNYLVYSLYFSDNYSSNLWIFEQKNTIYIEVTAEVFGYQDDILTYEYEVFPSIEELDSIIKEALEQIKINAKIVNKAYSMFDKWVEYMESNGIESGIETVIEERYGI
jgi:hypothetical protein